MRKLLQAAAIASAGVLLATAGTAAAAPASSATASNWMRGQLTHGLVHNTQYDVDDYGLTADTALALRQLGTRPKALKKTRKALAAHLDDWIRGGTSTDLYAGSVAKAALVADSLGGNARDFGGENLVKLLRGSLSKSGATKGRIHDTSAYGDYANTIGQALTAQALSAGAGHQGATAVRYLLRQQCSAGYFRLYFADPSAPQSCDAGDPASSSAPDPDATATALLSLQSLPHAGKRIKAAEKRATHWLIKQQRHNGSFLGGTSTSAPNANSTGLAASALAGAGRCAQAGEAAAWVAKVQVSAKRARGALSSQKGAIAYDKAGLKAARAAGITPETQDQWRRATAQAAPALRHLHAAHCG